MSAELDFSKKNTTKTRTGGGHIGGHNCHGSGVTSNRTSKGGIESSNNQTRELCRREQRARDKQ